MTPQIADQPRTGKRRTWLIVGLLTVLLGAVAFVSSAPLIMLEDTGWPWHTSISETTDGPTSAQVVEPNGETSTFTGSRAETEDWLDRKESDLRDTYGITTKIAVGRVLSNLGLVLLALGIAILVWRLIARRRAQRSPGRTDTPSGLGA